MFSSLKNQTSLLNTMQLSINKIPYYVPYIITYFIGFIILLIILLFIYVRIKYRFWALQPVFHVYDLYYWFVNAGVINKELPLKNRYTIFKNIKISFPVSGPTLNEIESVTPMPFEGGRSWTTGIEKGISGFSYYIFKKFIA